MRRCLSCSGPFPTKSRHTLQGVEWGFALTTRRSSPCAVWTKALSSFLLSCIFVLSAFAATGKPEIETQPSALELSFSDKSASVFVAVRNPDDSALKGMRLSWLANDRLKVEASGPKVKVSGPLELQALDPHAEYVWELKVTPLPPGGKIAETLYLRLDYAASIGEKLIPQVVFHPIQIKSRDLDSIDKLVDVQPKTTLTFLETTRSAVVYLMITNKSARPLFVNNIEVVGKPAFIDIAPPVKDHESASPPGSTTFSQIALQPYGTAVQTLNVQANERVEPGKYLLVFKISLGIPEGTAQRNSDFVTSQEVTLGVLGESAILTALGLPCFFLLPGCLVILTASLCWSTGWLRPETKPGEFPLKYKEPDFWLVSITVSLVMALIYRSIEQRWYFVRYGLEDIATIWLISIMLGFLAYVIWRMTVKWRDARRTFSKNDNAIAVLRKMHRLKIGLVLKRVTLKADPSEPRFVLQENDSRLWVCPQISIDLSQAKSDELKGQIRAQATKDGDPERLADLLARSTVVSDWKGAPAQGVQDLASADTNPAPPPDLVVGVV